MLVRTVFGFFGETREVRSFFFLEDELEVRNFEVQQVFTNMKYEAGDRQRELHLLKNSSSRSYHADWHVTQFVIAVAGMAWHGMPSIYHFHGMKQAHKLVNFR